MKCPECGFQNPENIPICLQCAASLQRRCPNCGSVAPWGQNFCGQCGTNLKGTSDPQSRPDAPQSQADLQKQLLKNLHDLMPTSLIQKIVQSQSQQFLGQRREVTILSLDIANLHQASQIISSEEMYLAIKYIMQLLTKIIYQYEGTIEQFSGEGVTAFFGIPLNHENDPERAVRAGLEILHAIEQRQPEIVSRFHYDFKVRAGIYTGSVLVGNIEPGQRVDYTVLGDALNLANQIRKTAEAGQILVNFSVYQRTAPIFEYQPCPMAEAALEPIGQTYIPIRLRLKPGQVRGLPGLHAPMIGRRDALSQIQAEKDRALAAACSQVILISGEAGLGKSRLVSEFAALQNPSEVKCYWGTCASYMRITPYRVVADMIRNILGVSELDPAPAQREALQQFLTQLGLDQRDILPNLLHVLGLLHSDPVIEARLKLLEPHMLQRETQLALRNFFTAVSQKQFSVFVFDDLHWVDQASQQFLEYLCQVLNGHPLLLVLVSRDFKSSESARLIAEAAKKRSKPPLQIELRPLPMPEARALIDQFIPETTESATRLKNDIIRRAAGIPFYTEELVRVLMDLGGLEFSDGRWEITAKAEELLTEVPGTLKDILLARFDRLPPHLRQTLQSASVLGESFAARLLGVILNQDLETLHANLAELEGRDFLAHTPLGGEPGYTFKHPLLQETIYKTLMRRDLQKLHYQVAEAIETGEHWLPAEHNQVLAWHYGKSHTPTRAIPFLLTSAEKASQHFANETVIQLYRQALAIMETEPQRYEEQIKQARVRLGQALKFAGKFEEAAQIFTNLLQAETTLSGQTALAQRSPSTIQIDCLRELADLRTREGNLTEAVDLLMQAMQILGDEAWQKHPSAWLRIVDRLAWVHFRQGKLDEAYNWADLALLQLRNWETDDPITLASLHNTIGGVYWTRSRYQEAIASVERSLSIYQDLGYQWGVSVALTNLGVLNYSIGKWRDCVEALERADQIRSNFGNHPERPINLVNLSEALIAMGDFALAREKLNISLEISQRLGSHIYQAYTELKFAHLAILEGNISEARLHLDSARQHLGSLNEISERTVQFFNYSAQLKMLEGDLENALIDTQRALEIATQGGFQEKKNEVLRTMGRIYIKMGDLILAEQLLKETLHEGGSEFNDAQAMFELAYLYTIRAQGNPAEAWVWYPQAENLLDQAIGIFTRLGAQQHLQQARNLQATILARRAEPLSESRSDSSLDEVNQLALIRKQLGIPEGEWHQATLLTIDLIPNQSVDEELLFETIAFLLPLLQEVIQERGGQVVRYSDGLAGIFGAPTAHEDDPVRAVEAAIQVANFHAELYQQTQLPISVRMGISMGKIVAGWTLPNPASPDQGSKFLAAGAPLQLSRLLAGLATPGHIWVTQPVFNATSFRFQFNPVPLDMLESLEEKEIYQVEGEREQILPVRGLIGLKTVFVGRQNEIQMLIDASLGLFNQSGRIVWIEGEPGIGKSRLTRELEQYVLPQGIQLLRGVCTGRRSDIAFSVFSNLLADALKIQPNYSPDQIYRQIESHFQQWSLDPELRPYIELLAGVQPRGALGEHLMRLEPEQLRRQTFVSLNRWISHLASIQPLVLVFDDIQWIDAISAELLLYLSPLVFSQRTMFICIQRTDEASPYEQTLTRIRQMTAQQCLQIRLKPLTYDECHHLLSHVLGDAKLDETLKTLIVQQSGGNPYYIEEFVRMLVEQDYLRLERGKLEVNQNFKIDRLRIPASLETLIRSRVDALPVLSRQLLQVAAVIGNRFTKEFLGAVADQGEIDIQLENLQRRGMLTFSPETGFWEFGHPLIEIIVYNTVLKVQRRILHERTAQALEQQWRGQESEHAEELAYHYSKAENQSKTLHYLILAGERAASRYANDAATDFFERAFNLLSVVDQASDLQRWKVITGLGAVYQFTGKFDASLSTLHTGLTMFEGSHLTPEQRAGLYRILADTYLHKGELDQAIAFQKKALACVEHPTQPTSQIEAARIYTRLGLSYFRKAALDEAQAAVLKAATLAAQTNNLPALAAAENLLGGIHWSLGDTQQAMQHTQQAMLYYQELGYTLGEAMALNNLAILEVNSGNLTAAANFFQRALKLRIAMGDIEGIALTHNNLAHLAFDQGNLEEAEASFRASLTISEPLKIGFHQATSYAGLVKTLLALKRSKEAARIFKHAVQLANEVEAREIITELKRLEAELYLEQDDLPEAERAAKAALQAAIEINSSGHESSARRVLSEVLARQRRPMQALGILDEAWASLSQSVDELEIGRVHAQYARLWNDIGDQDKFHTHLKIAHDIFSRLGARHDLDLLEGMAPAER